MTPIQALSTVLDEEHATEVVKHRQRLRKPLTDYAAKLLAKRLASFSDPNAAADIMIERGWQSIEQEWLQPRYNRQSTGLAAIEANFRQELQSAGGLRQTESPTHTAIQSLPLFTGRAH